MSDLRDRLAAAQETTEIPGTGIMVDEAKNKKKLSEVQLLKANNHKLASNNFVQARELAQIKSQLTQQKLTQQRTELEMEFRSALDASPEDKFNWETLTFGKK